MARPNDRDMFYEAVRALAGQDALDLMFRTVGGTRVELTTRAIAGNWLTQVVGLEVAQKIIDRVLTADADGRVVTIGFYMPLGRNSVRERVRTEAERLFKEGAQVRAVARTLGISERTAQRMRPFRSGRDRAKGSFIPAPRTKRYTPRIGFLEELIIAGEKDSLISRKMGLNRERIAARRKTLQEAGLLKPSIAGLADAGDVVAPDDEGSP